MQLDAETTPQVESEEGSSDLGSGVDRSFKYRFYPTAEQEPFLRQTIGCVRLVYNMALRDRKDAWSAWRAHLCVNQSADLTEWKRTPELEFLNEVSSVPLQQALRHLEAAYVNLRAGRARPPVYKKKRNGGSAEFTRSAFVFEGGQITLAKMDAPLDIRWSRQLPKGAYPSTVTISLDQAGRWHISLRCVDHDITRLPKLDAACGIDLGINDLVTFDSGEKVANPRFHEHELERLRKLSRELARKQRGSKNSGKAKLKLAKHHSMIADRRKDFLSKLSTRIVRENQVIVLETLNVAGMVHNRPLARVISDAGWSELVRQIEYKAKWYGRTVVKVDRFFPSSKLCSECGWKMEKLPLEIRTWACPRCGAKHDRDVNAAKNILAAGLAVAREGDVCGLGVRHGVLRGSVQPGLKQKRLEATP